MSEGFTILLSLNILFSNTLIDIYQVMKPSVVAVSNNNNSQSLSVSGGTMVKKQVSKYLPPGQVF